MGKIASLATYSNINQVVEQEQYVSGTRQYLGLKGLKKLRREAYH